MKNISAGIIGLILLSQAANAAAQCVNAARCPQLGYTQNLSDCTGLPTLICPFDSGKAFCPKHLTTDINRMTCEQMKAAVQIYNNSVILNNQIQDCGAGQIDIAEGVSVIGAVSSQVPIWQDNAQKAVLSGKNVSLLKNLSMSEFMGTVNEIDNCRISKLTSCNTTIINSYINNLIVKENSDCTISFLDSEIKNYELDLIPGKNLVFENNLIIPSGLSGTTGNLIVKGNLVQILEDKFNFGGNVDVTGDIFIKDYFISQTLGTRGIKAKRIFIEKMTRGGNVTIDADEMYIKVVENWSGEVNFKKNMILGIANEIGIKGKWQAVKNCEVILDYTGRKNADFEDCFTRIGDYDGSNWPTIPIE